MGEFAIGQGVARFEDPRLLRGGGRYVDDIVLPRMAMGYVLRSPHAHARIRSVDIARAVAAPGVLLVLTGADWKRSAARFSRHRITMRSSPDGSGRRLAAKLGGSSVKVEFRISTTEPATNARRPESIS